MNYQEWSHILLELALSVSGEQELRKLLRKSSRTFLSRLGSTHIGFYQWQEKISQPTDCFSTQSGRRSDGATYSKRN